MIFFRFNSIGNLSLVRASLRVKPSLKPHHLRFLAMQSQISTLRSILNARCCSVPVPILCRTWFGDVPYISRICPIYVPYISHTLKIWNIYGLYAYYLWNVCFINALQVYYRYGTDKNMMRIILLIFWSYFPCLFSSFLNTIPPYIDLLSFYV